MANATCTAPTTAVIVFFFIFKTCSLFPFAPPCQVRLWSNSVLVFSMAMHASCKRYLTLFAPICLSVYFAFFSFSSAFSSLSRNKHVLTFRNTATQDSRATPKNYLVKNGIFEELDACKYPHTSGRGASCASIIPFLFWR